MKRSGFAARALGVLLASIGAVGCGAGPAEPAPLAQRLPIVNGDPSPPGTTDDAVVLVRTAVQDEHLCSGTLVAPNLVLTVRHCVAYTGPEGFQCTVQGELIDNPNGGGVLGVDYPASSVEIFASLTPRTEPIARGAQIVSSLSPNVCQNDIAFVVLDRALELPLAPVRVRLPTARGELATLVGYGGDGVTEIELGSAPRLRLEHQRVLRVGPDSVADGVTTTRPRTLVFGGPASCRGDSGGPALSEATGAVIGVFSLLQRTDCLDPDIELYYTHTSTFERLALDAFAAAGSEPRFEDDRLLGEACSENHHCRGGLCAASARGETVCTETCDDEGSCPNGYACDASGVEPRCFPKDPSEPCADCQQQPPPPSPAPAAAPTDSGCSMRPLPRAPHSDSLAGLALIAACALRRRSRAVIRFGAALASASLFVACGGDEVILAANLDASSGAAAGATGAGGAGAAGGIDAGGSGGTGAAAGSAGSAATGGSAGGAGTSGTDASGGSGATDAGDAGDGPTASCEPPGSKYALEVCNRLTNAQWNTQGQETILRFVPLVTGTCSVGRVTREHPAPPDFFNALFEWSVALWGCRGTGAGVTTFGLVDQPAFGRLPPYLDEVSAADAKVLIDLYLSVVTVRLSLSSEEEAAMRRALECLAKSAITNPSTTEHELSNCPPDAGRDAAGDVASDGSADAADAEAE